MMPGDVNGLARFRADPKKVRVAVRRVHVRREHWERDARGAWHRTLVEKGFGWLVSVHPRDQNGGGCRGNAVVEWTGRTMPVAVAVDRALATAARDGLDGVDLDLSWAYEHPMCTPAQRAHYEQSVAAFAACPTCDGCGRVRVACGGTGTPALSG